MSLCEFCAGGNAYALNERGISWPSMTLIATNRERSAQIKKCNLCGQHWQVDEADRSRNGWALRIDPPQSWENFDEAAVLAPQLLKIYGGNSSETCAQYPCKAKAMKELAFCPSHAVERGIRE